MASALVLGLLLAAGLGACGSGDSTDSTATTAAKTTQETTATAPEDTGTGAAQQPGDDKGGSGESGSPSGSSQGGEGSSSFITPGGDNSVQNFGEEADSGERAEASDAVSAYLQARADGDWAKMCSYLSENARKPLEELAARAPQVKDNGCPAVLQALMGRLPPAARASTLTGEVASLRVEGDRGFVLYHGPQGVDYFVPMDKEGGKWLVGAIAPSEFL